MPGSGFEMTQSEVLVISPGDRVRGDGRVLGSRDRVRDPSSKLDGYVVIPAAADVAVQVEAGVAVPAVHRLRLVMRGGVPHRRDRSDHEAGFVGGHRCAVRREPEELLPVSRQLVPVTQPAEAQTRVDVVWCHSAEDHRSRCVHADRLPPQTACPGHVVHGRRATGQTESGERSRHFRIAAFQHCGSRAHGRGARESRWSPAATPSNTSQWHQATGRKEPGALSTFPHSRIPHSTLRLAGARAWCPPVSLESGGYILGWHASGHLRVPTRTSASPPIERTRPAMTGIATRW